MEPEPHLYLALQYYCLFLRRKGYPDAGIQEQT